MVKTLWPFIEWTEKIGKKNVKQLIIREEVLIGDDVVGNMGTLTKVEIFSSMLKPHTLSIKGEKVRGIIAENREGEYFYHALFEDAHAGEKIRLKVFIEGKSTRETLKEDGYYSNFAWNTRHVQRIIFPRGWKILSAIPNGYVLETFKGLPSIKWDRDGKFWGDVQVKVKRG
jgi:hypothetical protein